MKYIFFCNYKMISYLIFYKILLIVYLCMIKYLISYVIILLVEVFLCNKL